MKVFTIALKKKFLLVLLYNGMLKLKLKIMSILLKAEKETENQIQLQAQRLQLNQIKILFLKNEIN
jgi:hypothetical protein